MYKKLFSLILSFMLISGILITRGNFAVQAGAENFTASFDVEYRQTEARSMLKMINDFRTGSSAWAWDENNSSKIYYNGLNKLQYDYDLEKVAMQRAAELVIAYSHTRPDGQSCFTANSANYNSLGENICIGTGDLDAKSAFNLWLEEQEKYDGQGHRRNMLSEKHTAVGIAHVYWRGCHYWVQEFQSPVHNTTYEKPVDSLKDVTVEVDKNSITDGDFEFLSIDRDSWITLDNNVGTCHIHPGSSVTVKAVYTFRTDKTWQYAPFAFSDTECNWTVSDTENSNITANGSKISVGALPKNKESFTGELTTVINGKTIKLNIISKHYYDDWKITKQPTCTATGIKTRKCSCGETETQVSPKTAHKAKTVPGKAATCTKAGYTASKVCAHCGKVLQAKKTIKATGKHVYKVVKTVKPTYIANGYTLKKCACGKTVKTNIKPKLVLKNPAKVITAGQKKKAVIKWSAVKGATGYKVFMKTSKNGSYKAVKSLKTRRLVKSGLKSGKTYYFAVKAYKKVGGKYVFSKAAYKTVKVK